MGFDCAVAVSQACDRRSEPERHTLPPICRCLKCSLWCCQIGIDVEPQIHLDLKDDRQPVSTQFSPCFAGFGVNGVTMTEFQNCALKVELHRNLSAGPHYAACLAVPQL